MYKTSEFDANEIIQRITSNKLGLLLLEKDGDSLPATLAEHGTWNDRRLLIGSEYQIVYHLFPILYKKDPQPRDFSDLIEIRAAAVRNVFDRWTAAGCNTRHAKSPFKSNDFMRYLDDIGYKNADYLLLWVI